MRDAGRLDHLKLLEPGSGGAEIVEEPGSASEAPVRRLSVSLTTVELRPERAGTLLVLNEHGVFFDGLEPPTLREQGTGSLLDAISRVL